jgi:hypothetical protein
MFGATFLVALSYMLHARIERRFDTIFARLLVVFLAFMQPLGRGWARYFTWMKYKHTPRVVISTPESGIAVASRRGGISRLDFWNETGQGREQLLTEVFSLLETEGWRYSSDTGWKDWDLQIYGNQFWSVQLRTVTEYHGGPKCLTRVQLKARPVVTTVLGNALPLVFLLARAIFFEKSDPWLWTIYAAWLFWLLTRAWRLKRRVADLVIAGGARCSLVRVFGKASKPAPPA